MAQATPEQVKQLEQAHKQQFADLVTAWNVAYNIILKEGNTAQSFAKVKPFMLRLAPITAKWVSRQRMFETKAPGASTGLGNRKIWNNDFSTYDPNHFGYLLNLKNLIDAQKQTGKNQTGFIPLLIWAVIAIVAAFTATEIVDETNTTTEEQADLVATTQQFCKDNNLTGEDCKNLVQSNTAATTDQGGGLFGGMKSILLWGLGAFVVFKFVIPEFNKSKSNDNKAAA